jgi:hypothetical protein
MLIILPDFRGIIDFRATTWATRKQASTFSAITLF